MHASQVCSGPRWATRMQYGTVPVGLETCHGVADAGKELELTALGSGEVCGPWLGVGVGAGQWRGM